jgi:hypothetical protein
MLLVYFRDSDLEVRTPGYQFLAHKEKDTVEGGFEPSSGPAPDAI